MALYHLSIKIFSRGKGRSAVAAAAYRAAELIKSEYNGVTHDYTRKSGVIHKEILLPENAPPEYSDRATLWNAVEMAERNDNAQLAREIELSLPRELTREQNISLVREYVQRRFVDKGMCADVCVHDRKDGNPHAHIMLTLRPFNEDGTWAAKSKKEYILDANGERTRLPSGAFKTRKISAVDWNEQTKAEEWRAAWADAVNAALERQKVAVRVDHRSYIRQGVEKIPTVHMGVAATRMEKRGIRTERGDINRAIGITNQQIRQLRARINKVKGWLYSQPLTNAPSLIDMMNGVAGGKNLQTRWQKIANLKTRAHVLIFLQQNHVTDVEQLAGTVERMYARQYDVANKIKAGDRRLGTLNTHLAQYENYKRHKAVYQKYQQLAPKKRDAFYDKHGEEIQRYESAKRYLDAVMNGRTTVPIKAWSAEQMRLTAERFSLCEDYYRLKDDVKSVEVLRRGAENLMRRDEQMARSPRERGMER